MSRRTMGGAAATPGLSSIVWLAGLVFGIAVGVVLVYHFVLASRSGNFPTSKAVAAEMRETPTDIGDAHAEALKEAMDTAAKK